MILCIAWRNIRRNSRRSTATIVALAVGAIAMLLFGGFVFSIYYGVQTRLFSEQGHIHIYAEGYTAYGAVEPEYYTIENYPALMSLLRDDIFLSSKVRVITPQTRLSGIAGVVATDNSKLFSGLGVVPEDLDRMLQWDGWDLRMGNESSGLTGQGTDAAVTGFGMARMLGLCQQLGLENCVDPPSKEQDTLPLSGAASQDTLAPWLPDSGVALGIYEPLNYEGVAVNLLAANFVGLPNIEAVRVVGVRQQGIKSVDDMYMLLHFELARNLLFGDKPQATRIVVQVNEPTDMLPVKDYITALLSHADTGMTYEVLSMIEVDPTFANILKMFTFIFGVVSIFLGVVIVSAITNTINMTVMERTNETGIIRAMGFRKSFIRRMFLTESVLLGLLGLACGLISTLVFEQLINAMHIGWTPPSNATPIPIQLMVFTNPLLAGGVAAFIIGLSALAGILPARRAARMPIVQALNHV